MSVLSKLTSAVDVDCALLELVEMAFAVCIKTETAFMDASSVMAVRENLKSASEHA